MIDGSLTFDTRIDTGGFVSGTNTLKKQANGLSGTFTKLGGVIAATFAVRAIVNFGKQAVTLASDLEEVQNVVDVAFGSMSYKMEQFAETSIDTFGLSRLEAKRTGSSFMAMATGMNIAIDKASDMSIELTGLSADMASFYNMNQSEARTALSSIYTGETETLKRYGILITEVNLQEYARQKGINKSIEKMTQQEKTMLRYNYVLNATKLAQGDFARTSGSWANQVRVLSERWKEFATVIGNVIMNVALPVVKALNTAMSGLIKVANSMAKALGLDKKQQQSTEQIVTDTGTASDNLGDMADNAEKAKKTMKSLAGFDEINKLASNSKDTGGGSIGGDIDIDTPGDSSALEEQADIVEGLKTKLQELVDLFKDGFNAGLGEDFSNSLGRTKEHIESIGKSLKEIFTDPAVASSANACADKIAYAFGQVTGSVVSIGATIAENLTGGFDLYLQQNSPYIKERLVGIFDATGAIAEQSGEIWKVSAEIFEVFRSPEAKQCTADFIGIFTNAGLGISEVSLKIVQDVQKCLAKPIIDNVEKIKLATMNTIKPMGTVLSILNTGVKDTFNKIIEVYDAKIAPMFEKIQTGLSEVLGKFLDAYNTHIAPVLQNLADKFAVLWEESIQPAIDKVVEFFGKIGELFGVIFENVLVPFGEWFAETIMPIVAPVLEALGTLFLQLWETLSDFVGGIMETLGFLVDFLIGVFSGDWSKAWESIKSMFSSAWDSMVTNLSNVGETICSVASSIFELLKSGITTALEAIKAVFSTVWEAISSFVVEVVTTIKDKIVEVFTSVKEKISAIWESVKTVTSTVWNTIVDVVTGVVDKLKNGITTAFEKIKTVTTEIFTKVKDTITGIFTEIWDFIKGIINTILGGIESMTNGVIGGLNGMISAMNNVEFDVPDWVPGIGGKTFGFAIPELGKIAIPRLATGTVVPANAGEFMAVLGDNKREPEVISPLSTIKQAVAEVLAGMQGATQGGNITIPIYLDGGLIDEVIVNAQQRQMIRSNGRA